MWDMEMRMGIFFSLIWARDVMPEALFTMKCIRVESCRLRRPMTFSVGFL